MSAPVPRVNNFMKKDYGPIIIDPISKIFIIAQLFFGINRAVLVGVTKKRLKAVVFCYTVLINVTVVYFWIEHDRDVLFWVFILIPDILKSLVFDILGLLFHRRLLIYYKKINVLDKDIGSKIKNSDIGGTLYNIIQVIMTIVLIFISKLYIDKHHDDLGKLLTYIFRKILICIELHFYVHLLLVMLHRLKLFTRHLRFSYPDNRDVLPYEDTTRTEDVQRASNMDMKKFMDLYNKIIITHESLIEAIKWQVLTVLMMTFLITLQMSYRFVKITLKEDLNFLSDVARHISHLLVEMMPLLLLCVIADRINEEVHLISDILTCRLYESRSLDKSDRSTARALLALTKRRKLSFSLFHMFDIDISLPFKYLGFLLTYLVILLQFDKVISPNSTH